MNKVQWLSYQDYIAVQELFNPQLYETVVTAMLIMKPCDCAGKSDSVYFRKVTHFYLGTDRREHIQDREELTQ